MKKLRLKNIKYLVLGHKVECACTVPGQLLIHHIHISWASLCLMNSVVFACLFAKNIYIYMCVCVYIYVWWRFSSSLSLPSPLEHYLWVSPAFSDSCSWDPGMTNRTMLIQSQKTFLFQGLWLITKVVNGKPWTRIYEFLGGGPWMSLFPYN